MSLQLDTALGVGNEKHPAVSRILSMLQKLTFAAVVAALAASPAIGKDTHFVIGVNSFGESACGVAAASTELASDAREKRAEPGSLNGSAVPIVGKQYPVPDLDKNPVVGCR
ncbi:hypothetical protein [Rhizobium leguminosarum]|uniref:hypothetical protein n=1 Tax=Rhizobium leguminosarum TaxID=384 RepID=UPI001C940464|nr:hypothetical protein [Rhizobium leguminosarum]MBY5827700.1 hypothetical protein [Rhizobium leguminosarum]